MATDSGEVDDGKSAMPHAQSADATDATVKDKNAESESLSKTPSLCGICNTNPSKYKCSLCRLPYCSVACSKIHRDNHPPGTEPPSQRLLPPSDVSVSELPKLVDARNPFRTLDTDTLRWLFAKYPSLPAQLRKIHSATLPPPPESSSAKDAIPASLLKGLPPKKDAWNHDIGIQNGKEALQRARSLDSVDGEGVREYCHLITYMLKGNDPENLIDEIV